MSSGSGQGRIRVLYVGKSPAQHAFTRLLGEGNPDLALTTSSQPEEIPNILRGGFDCLVLAESKPYIDGEKIVRAIRERGFSGLPVIVEKGKKKNGKDTDKPQEDGAAAERLADEIRRVKKSTPAACEEKRGFNSSPIG